VPLPRLACWSGPTPTLSCFDFTAITLLVWWPRRAADYEYLGLKVDLFLEEMLDYAARAIRPLGLFFPQPPLSRLARIALRIS
jgi:hypothetical protein